MQNVLSSCQSFLKDHSIIIGKRETKTEERGDPTNGSGAEAEDGGSRDTKSHPALLVRDFPANNLYVAKL